MRSKILIYEDYGCSDITPLLKELKSYFEPRGFHVALTDAAGILRENALTEDVLAFFMPGGSGTPYRQKLKVQGNNLIRDFVHAGGIYYGICAGAYYACEQTIFEKDIPNLQLIDAYGLDLVKGKAIGTLHKELNLPPFDNSIHSSTVVDILWRDGKMYRALYHGGPYFETENVDDVEVLAYYNFADKKPAILKKKFGQGQVIISGVHYENTGHDLLKVINRIREDDMNAKMVAHRLVAAEPVRHALFERMMSLSGR